MHNRFLLWMILPILVVAAVAEELLICPACRREAPPGSSFCPKCGTSLGGAAAPSPESSALPAPSAALPAAVQPPAKSDASVAADAAAGIRDCVQAGRRQFADGHPEVARVLFGNALALAGLGPDVLTPDQGRALLAESQNCDARLATVVAECPVCRGSGKMSMNVTSLGSSRAAATTTAVSSGAPCRTCGGTGKTHRRRTVAEGKTSQGVGQKAAETVFRSMGFLQEGNAWIPQSIAPRLDIVQRCRLRNAAAAPCAQCGGFGREDCRKCGATGYVPCKAKGCQGGWVIEDAINGLDSKSATLKTRKACPECGGSAMIPCTDCQGRGSKPCPRCNGSGQRGVCSACGGEGRESCRACGGTGHPKGRPGQDAAGDCAVCSGAGTVFCRSCHGDGHAAR